MLLIDFFEKTPISSLVPVNSIAPDRVVFLIDEANLSSLEAKHMRKAVEMLGCVREFAYKPVDIENISSIKECLAGIVGRSREEEEVYIDMTGGSELMVAAGYHIANGTKAIPIYADVWKGTVIRVDDATPVCPVKHISSEHYLTAIGAKRLRNSHNLPEEEEEDDILAMAEMLFGRTGDWHELCDRIAKAVSGREGSRFTLAPTDPDRKADTPQPKVDDLLAAFVAHGFLRELGENQYEFAREKYREYLTVYGVWLEMYIYLKGRPHFDEAYLGMVFDWNVDDARDSEDNEVDVVFLKDSIPYFVSCKMRRIEAQDIYEIGFIAQHFGGEYARRFIATSHELDSAKMGQRSLLAKMHNMDVGLLLTGDVRREGLVTLMLE